MKEVNFFTSKINTLTMHETTEEIKKRIINGVFTQHAVVNVAKLIHMNSDHALKESVNSCDIINVDGMGVVWGARFLGYNIPERVAGIDLFHQLLSMSANNNFPVYLLGASEEVVAKTTKTVETLYPGLKVAGYHHGYFWDNEEKMVETIRNSNAQLLFVAITSPKKENFINRWKDQLGVNFVMGVGGTFDVVSGKVKRAPLWMQRYGLEWLYRVIQEPGRMWKRYLTTNVQFAWLVVIEKYKQLRSKN